MQTAVAGVSKGVEWAVSDLDAAQISAVCVTCADIQRGPAVCFNTRVRPTMLV